MATAHSHAGEAVGTTRRRWRRPIPGWSTRRAIRRASTGSTWCSADCPTGSHSVWSPSCRSRVGLVVDLAADFRLKDAALYPRWYGEEHGAPALLGEAVYGLPELFRPALAGATLVAAAGCYPTAAGLALAPLLRAGLVETERDRGRRRLRRVGGRAGGSRSRCTSARSTRTSPPTGC